MMNFKVFGAFTKSSKVLVVTALLSGTVLSGCTWVKPIEGSEKVKLVDATYISGCKLLGHTNTFVKNDVAGLTRNQETVTEELVTIGKNQAVDLGGDTIVQKEPMKDGKMSFDVYKCQQ